MRDLWVPGLKVWNSSLVHLLFTNDQANAILNTPLFPCIGQDHMLWSPNANGQYSVKSGYYIAMHKRLDDSNLRCEGEWHLIWDLQVPP